MVGFVIYGRGSFDQLNEIIAPHRKAGSPMIFLVDHFFEGKRQKITFQCANTTGIAWNDNSMIYPIPQQEVDQNKSMVQNPGY